jgi:Nuclease-related domain
MTENQVTRWRKYGKDRLYVNGADGVRIGWLDNVSGERVIERPEFAEAFEAALAQESLSAGRVLHAPKPQLAAPVPRPLPREPIWVDLADNRPGQAAREQAVAEREAMRERSKAGTFMARLFDVKTDERAWRVGADGEEAVGARLASLEQHGWRILHAVNVGTRGSDIDHVAIGPGGVYTLNTKTHLGHRITVYEHAILIDGHKQPYLRNSRHEAARATRLLTQACGFAVTAAPLIVVLCDALTIKKQPDDVQVVGRRDIALWLRKRPAILGAAEIDAIWVHARRSTTWQPGAV